MVGERHDDGETSIDMFFWQVRDLASVQSGFGLTHAEVQAMGGLADGDQLEVTLKALVPGKPGAVLKEQRLETATFTAHQAQGLMYISAVLSVDILDALKKAEEIDLYSKGQLLRAVDLTGSAAAAAQMGPCMAAIGAHLEGKR